MAGTLLDPTPDFEPDASAVDLGWRVAASMAHQFNNILAGIGSFAEYLNRNAADDGTRHVASQIGKAVHRGKSFTGEILRYTRAKPPALKTIAVAPWLESFHAEANAVAGRSVVVESEPELSIRGDASQLKVVLINLLTNAREASSSDAPILLRAAATTRDGTPMLDLAVIDQGTGISPEVCKRLFEPLFTTRRSGAGLGLPVVDQIVRAHGGVVRVRTEVGKGSEFHVLLPF